MARYAPADSMSFVELQQAFRPFTDYDESFTHVRQSLVKYLQTFIDLSRKDLTFRPCLPDPATTVLIKDIPTEVTGVYRRYLKSLQAQISARKRLEELSTVLSGQDGPKPASNTETEDVLKNHVDLLQKRERVHVLQILQHYLNELLTMQVSQDNFRISSSTVQLGSLSRSEQESAFTSGETRSDALATENMTEKLETTILKAKSQLKQHQLTLEKLQSLRDSSSSLELSGNRRKGLARSRDELHSWVQEKLASSDLVQPRNQDNDTDRLEILPDESKSGPSVPTNYERYFEMRKRLINIASALSKPSLTNNKTVIKPRSSTRNTQRPDHMFPLLPFITSQLLKTEEFERQLGCQTQLISDVHRDGRIVIDATFERSQDESHLLHSYPLLAKQERFRQLSNALGGDRLQSRAPETREDIQEHIRAWKFASAASGTALQEFLEGHFRQATGALDKSEQSLDDLRAQLGVGNRAKTSSDDESGDIWTAEIDKGVSNIDIEGSRDGRGPWSELNGRVGVTN